MIFPLGLPSRKKSQPSRVQPPPRVPITPELPAPPDTLAASSLAESPEMPEFTSNFMKALMNAKNQEKPKEGKSRPTPEFPGLEERGGGVFNEQNARQSRINLL